MPFLSLLSLLLALPALAAGPLAPCKGQSHAELVGKTAKLEARRRELLKEIAASPQVRCRREPPRPEIQQRTLDYASDFTATLAEVRAAAAGKGVKKDCLRALESFVKSSEPELRKVYSALEAKCPGG